MHERGFNQAFELANRIESFSVKELLFKNPTHTGTKQALTKNRSQRLKNVVGAFCVKKFSGNPAKFGVILVDDVTTTGATLSEARKTLRKAGFKTVHAVALAFQPLEK